MKKLIYSLLIVISTLMCTGIGAMLPDQSRRMQQEWWLSLTPEEQVEFLQKSKMQMQYPGDWEMHYHLRKMQQDQARPEYELEELL